MNVITTAEMTTNIQQVHASTPRFFGIVGGELRKIFHLWSFWVMGVLLIGVICLPYLINVTSAYTKTSLHTGRGGPLHFFYNSMGLDLSVLRIFIGIFLLILTPYVIGQEYQLGTIRILLARGVGRIQLLLAKLFTLSIIALMLLVVGIVLNIVLSYLMILVVDGSTKTLSALTPDFWSNTWLYILTVLVSMGVTILLAAAPTVLTRSLAAGLGASIAWFAVDNIGSAFMTIGYSVTHNDLWLKVTAYLLGPNLNGMASEVLPAKIGESVGITPLVKVDGPHTLWVALVYAIIFAVVAIVLIWRRDVKE